MVTYASLGGGSSKKKTTINLTRLKIQSYLKVKSVIFGRFLRERLREIVKSVNRLTDRFIG